MKAFYSTKGDPSVGVPGVQATLEIHDTGEADVFGGDAENRAAFRDGLRAALDGLIGDGRGTVLFDDECPECGGAMEHASGCPEIAKRFGSK